MHRFTKYLAIASLLAMGITKTWADDTNLVQEISIRLLGMKQGQPTTTRGIIATTVDVTVVDTRQVINALGTAMGTTFPPTAKLVLITPLAGGACSVEVRDGVNPVDVSPFFNYELVRGKLNNSLVNLRTGRNLFSDFSIQRFALVDAWALLSLHFDVRGIAVSTSRTAPESAPTYETTIEASGAGDRAGNLLILQGIIRIQGNTLEVVSTGGGGPS